ncbi:MAG TPA: hypothetical protein PK095_24395 [Myxococcota bacterium]|nr:hypothetical protein [Myxococcota bacterium]
MKTLLSALMLLVLPACDSLERRLDGVAAPLKEPELPNCSRVLNCCANLGTDRLVGPLVDESCAAIATPTDLAILRYQEARALILNDRATSQQTKDQLLTELRQTSQGTLEPACRCLLDQTLGAVSLDGFLTPIDCEVFPQTGAIPTGKTCDELTGAIMSPASP